jgi:ubiquinone/menaquinone biosynthesis C-methylase UbiE
MSPHVCPWWGGYFIDNRLRRLLHGPERILGDYLAPGMTAMDVGCGMGLFALAMARLVGPEGRVIAVDVQQRMLDVLRRRAVKAGLSDRVRLHHCEPDTLGLDATVDSTVDFALAFYSVHEMPDARRLFDELHRCLTPHGRLLIVEPIGHVRAAQFVTMLSQAAQAGFHPTAQPAVRLSHTALLTKDASPIPETGPSPRP